MLQKKSKGGRCWVTFTLKASEGEEAFVVGEWNNWKPQKMRRKKDGTFWFARAFPVGKTYRFRYLLGNGCWLNDEAADGYCPNPFGSEDCVLQT
ncbi:hypothetical protein FVE67_06215 [Thermosulfurimonas marina]|uniref:AMP-activated protein kinase glycogen-binding domain-containing protein n=1 Tax=Thermosulfurimonas marina TaxID=2047767 RepID=A0A6H1WTE2_9BACT|nr:isoamylase early set domain-containing protein [Thermosulfurimonas marina]QJA06419.1 hypothetical protein FVE67_06215 [Thermosulfurimonas marina]